MLLSEVHGDEPGGMIPWKSPDLRGMTFEDDAGREFALCEIDRRDHSIHSAKKG
jgi:hypothetical protein